MTQVETSNSSIQGLKCLNMMREENLYPPHPRETDDSSRNLKFFNSRFKMFEYDEGRESVCSSRKTLSVETSET